MKQNQARMKIKQMYRSLLGIGLAFACGVSVHAQTTVPSTFKHITIDGTLSDWTGVPLAYTAPVGPTDAIQYENVYIANDQNNIYVRFTLYSPRTNAFANSFDNFFVDADANPLTGFPAGGIGSSMLIQWGGGYQEKNGGFNEGNVNNLGWSIAGSPAYTDFEIAISRNATFASDSTPVFAGSSIALVLEGDNTSYASVEFAPVSGGFVYTFADVPGILTTNLPLMTLAGSSWQVNASGTDLGTNWLDSLYDDSQSPWSSGSGLFGYTSTPGAYPAINTVLSSSGQNTYYFRTHFSWNYLVDNVAFVVTNYLSDGAVYYINGVEVNRVRMPAGDVGYATSASGTNSPAGQVAIFAIPAGVLQIGDNLLEVEAHQAPASSADMVFGMSFTAAAQYPIRNLDPSQPADRTVIAGNPTTFSANLLASGPLSYQWLKNSNSIPGATNATYTIPTVIYSDAGYYALLVSNPVSTNTTRAALLTVSNTPVTLAEATLPADVVAVAGQAVTLSSSVVGSPPMQFQWYQGNNAIAGATNATYTIPFLTSSNSGAYHFNVSNQANNTNSRAALLVVLPDTIAPVITHISAGATQIVVSFSKPVDPVSAGSISHYSVSSGVSVTNAVVNPADATQVILTTGSTLNLGVVYTLSVSGVKDLFGNEVLLTVSFARDITIDGSFGDWDSIPAVYTGPSLSTSLAADFAAIYVYNDADNYYFRVTLWHDVDPASGLQFPAYANLYFDTDNDVTTGHLPGTVGAELLTETGGGYQEKNGGFNEGGINGLNWSCLPASTNSDFEFSMSRSATYASDGLPVFTTNVLNFHFEGQTASFVAVNEVPAGGVLSYSNVTVTVPSLPLGRLAVDSLPNRRLAVLWNSPGTLQTRSSLTGGAWTNLPSATSPYIMTGPASQMFFRLAQ